MRKQYAAVAGFVLFLMILVPCNAGAMNLRGYLPVRQGQFWNFKESGTNRMSTWAINGVLTLKKTGAVFLLQQDDGRFLCLRNDWEGLRIYAEYGPDGYKTAQSPLLFLPADMKQDQPVQVSADFKVFSDPEGQMNLKENGIVSRQITFIFKGFENLTIEGKEFKDCAVIEKTGSVQGGTVVETLWLAQTMGPVKRTTVDKGRTTTFTMVSCAGFSFSCDVDATVRDLFPLVSSTTWTYSDHKKTRWTTETSEPVFVEGISTVPFHEDSTDIYYYGMDNRGLLLVQRYWGMVGACSAFHPPDQPLVILPAHLTPGTYSESVSRARVHTWPSMTMMEEFYPELGCSTIALLTETVTVPAGTYPDCMKVSFFFISKNYSMNNEQVRIGSCWLAKGSGVVKERIIDMTNYFSPLRENRISAVRFWDLQKTGGGNQPSAGKPDPA